VLDQGKRRSASDALRISTAKAAVMRWAVGFASDGSPASYARNCSVSEIDAANEWFGHLYDKLAETATVFGKGRTVAPITFAVATRVGMGQGKAILPVWRAYVLLDVQGIPVSVGSLMKRLDHGKGSYRGDAVKLAIEAFMAFDPTRFDVALGGIRNEDMGIDKIRAEIHRIRNLHADKITTI
jgi:hypothetical protein